MMAEICERLVAGRPAAVAGRRLRSHAASRYSRPSISSGSRAPRSSSAPRISICWIRRNIRNSPLAIVFGEGREVRHRIDDPESKRFPFLDDMRAEGVTDYIALPLLLRPMATIHASSWTTKQPGGFSDEQLDGAAIADAAAGPARRDHQPAPHGLDPARHLCRQPRRRADSRRPDPPRPHRDDACRDLAVGSARFYRAVGPAAGRDRGRYSQSLFRLPGAGDPDAMAARS